MPRIVTALAVLVLAGFAGMFASSPAFASDPPGDCWQGALAHDPLHCRVLEALQREGTVEVDGIFRAPEGGILVYLSKPKPEEDARLISIGDHRTKLIEKATSDLLKAKLAELVAQSPDSFDYDHRAMHVCVFRDENDRYEPDAVVPYADADEAVKAKYRECLANSPPWATQWMSLGLAGYGDVVLVLAEAETHKQVTGWASWTTLWPLESGLVREAVDYTGPFDVSGVDMGSIPPNRCEVEATNNIGYRSLDCIFRGRHPDLNIVGVTPEKRTSQGIFVQGILYFQVIDPPSSKLANISAKAAIADPMPRVSPRQIHFIPARNSYEEIWRAEVLLKRFAKSSGNTLGIMEVLAGSNNAYGDEYVYLHGYEPAAKDQNGDVDASSVRRFVVLSASDAQRVADALPQLTVQLGIPASTVGMVRDIHPEAAPLELFSGGHDITEPTTKDNFDMGQVYVGEAMVANPQSDAQRNWVPIAFVISGSVAIVSVGLVGTKIWKDRASMP